MANLKNNHRLLAALSVPPPNYIEDVFSAYVYNGTGANRTISNGLDLAGKGGLVWSKSRAYAVQHLFVDTVRGANNCLFSDLTNAQSAPGLSVTGFTSSGYTLGTDNVQQSCNSSNAIFSPYVSWSFAKAIGFFDFGTFTCGTNSNRRISHNLGIAPGMYVIKNTQSTEDWYIYHASLARSYILKLNTTAAQQNIANVWGTSDPTTTDFGIDENAIGHNGQTFVWYAWAHNPELVQCGSFTTDGSGNASVNLGWEIQYATLKNISSAENWITVDSARGMPVGSNDQQLYPNLANVEAAAATLSPTAVGFDATGLTASKSYVYLAIRRGPMKPPASGVQVYNAVARTGTGAAATVTGVGFPPDVSWFRPRGSNSYPGQFYSRLRGALKSLWIGDKEYSITESVKSFDMDGETLGLDNNGSYGGGVNTNAATYINWFLRRYPGVFDEICFTGSGAAKTEPHNLTVVPELWIVHCRGLSKLGIIGSLSMATTEYLEFGSTAAKATDATAWNSAYPTASLLSLGSQVNVNDAGVTFNAWLFATLAGISKVGSYIGNGTSLTLNMGFAAGARFFSCKRIDSAGDWFVWDSVRGIVAGNDPHVSINSNAVEVTTDDSVDPDNSGIIVNESSATHINVNGATYIYLAIA